MAISREYEHNIRALMDDFHHWVILGGFEGVGYTARRRDEKTSKGYGPAVTAMTLDELAYKMDVCDDADREKAAAESRAGRLQAM